MLKLLLSVGFSIMLLGLHAQQEDSRLHGLKMEIDSLMNNNNTVGLSLTIIEDDKVLYTSGFGYRDQKRKLPVTSNTLFSIGSVSKSFTAALIGVYQGRGLLSVNDQPKEYIESLTFNTDEMNNLVEIRDLLCHASGIGNVDGTSVFFPTYDISKHMARLPYLTPNSKVRERFDYSNMGYAILSRISEKISKNTWAENIRNEIFKPLGMSTTNSSLEEMHLSKDYSLGYSVLNSESVEVIGEDLHESAASGAINSSANDMAKYVLMLLNGGQYNGQQIVPQNYIEESFNPQIIVRNTFSFNNKSELLFDTYGYGWFVHQHNGLYVVSHGGNVSGFTANVKLLPEKKIGIIILSNQGSAGQLTNAINDIVLNRMLSLNSKSWRDYEIEVGQASVPMVDIGTMNAEKPMTHTLNSYCGKYTNKGYGNLEIVEDGDNLLLRMPAFTMALEHQYYNTFVNRTIENTHQNTPSFYLGFQTNNYGDITEIVFPIQSSPVNFYKVE